MADDSLSILAYGAAGSGKTTLGLTGPKPTLLLDAETASRFIPKNRKIFWDPMREAPPQWTPDSEWDICVVRTNTWQIASKVMEYLRSHKHPFRTVSVDSISEVQIKAKSEITKGQFKIQHWGELGQNMGAMLRELRDVTADPDSPIRILYLISIARQTKLEGGGTEWRAFLEGSTAQIIPYLYDITAYVYIDKVQADPNNPGAGYKNEQFFFTGKHPTIDAKSRVPDLPEKIPGLSLAGLLRNVFGDDGQTESTPPKTDKKSSSKPEKKAPEPSAEEDDVPPLPTN